MELIGFDDGTHLDLHTKQGAYEYVGRFLSKHGAASDVWSALGKIWKDPTHTEVDKKRLESIRKIEIVQPDSSQKVMYGADRILAYLTGEDEHEN